MSEISTLMQTQIRALLTLTASTAQRMNLTLSEVAALEHIHASGEITPKSLGQRLSLSSGAMTALVDRLEKGNWVERRPNPADRRSVLIVPTPVMVKQRQSESGRRLLVQIDEIGERFSDGEQAAIKRFISEVTELFDEVGESRGK